MLKTISFFLVVIFITGCQTKPPGIGSKVTDETELTSEKQLYRKTYTKLTDLVHQRLNISFDWKKRHIKGDATVTLHHHYYASDSVILNAKGMDLYEVALVTKDGKHLPLKFSYDSLLIRIKLDKIYSKDENFTLFINYLSKPDDLNNVGSEAIGGDKGFYFIDPDSLDPETPTQFWTQGETESNSVWFPTIEDPSQRMTQEIYMTIDTPWKTLSNGLLISSVNNNNGTRTDYWKQSIPAAPYLTMVAAGNYSIVKDKWKHIDVNYYVDPPYEKYARTIFGNTPEMITFFEKLFGVPYVWEKYSQIVVHDYISGAMENTTAVIHGTNMQQDSRDHADGNYEDYISHELAHHWFGNLVTCESWSNITLNEGFANYSEYMWREHKFGREAADKLNLSDIRTYMFVAKESDPPLFRVHYDNREDVYDAISYNKGGRVLHMLRKYVGDTAFFDAIKYYLTIHSYSSVEIHDLRIAFEKITGEDLNWFFDQWYNKGGHPTIVIDYSWNDTLKQQSITINQKQKLSENPLYRLPLEVDIYYNGKKERKKIVAENITDKFTFTLPVKPDLVNVDAEKMLLCSKTDNKSNSSLIFQYNNAPLYMDRHEAISKIGSSYTVKTPEAHVIQKALDDKFYGIRVLALTNVGEIALNHPDTIKEKIRLLATTDSSADVREKALFVIGKYFSYSEFSSLIADALKDSSYKVVGRAFKIIASQDAVKAKEIALVLERDSGNAIISKLSEFYNTSTEDKNEYYKKALRAGDVYTHFQVISDYEKYLSASSDPGILKRGTDILLENTKKPGAKAFRSTFIGSLKQIELSIKDKIESAESGKTEIATDKISKQAMIAELKALNNKLHEEIIALDK
jgi:aminopeptidase N